MFIYNFYVSYCFESVKNMDTMFQCAVVDGDRQHIFEMIYAQHSANDGVCKSNKTSFTLMLIRSFDRIQLTTHLPEFLVFTCTWSFLENS